jgi:hypothetical protein
MSEKVQKADHGRCGTRKKNGGTCGLPAGWGTDHVGTGRCRKHLGSTKSHRKKAQREIAIAAVASLGLRRDVSPQEALIEVVQRRAADVEYLAAKVAAIEERDLVWGVERVETGDGDGDGGGDKRVEAARPSVWLEEYNRACRDLAVFAAAALKAGVEERAVRLAEDQGRIVARVIVGVAKRLGVDSTTREFALAVREELSLAASSSGDVIDVTPTKRGGDR